VAVLTLAVFCGVAGWIVVRSSESDVSVDLTPGDTANVPDEDAFCRWFRYRTAASWLDQADGLLGEDRTTDTDESIVAVLNVAVASSPAELYDQALQVHAAVLDALEEDRESSPAARRAASTLDRYVDANCPVLEQPPGNPSTMVTEPATTVP
jgi:hypothetical protein